jgi:hypothetical protein
VSGYQALIGNSIRMIMSADSMTMCDSLVRKCRLFTKAKSSFERRRKVKSLCITFANLGLSRATSFARNAHVYKQT